MLDLGILFETAMMAEVRIERTALTSPIALTLIEALNDELDHRYPEELARHYRLDAEEVAPGRGAFLVAYIDGDPAGCGAVRRLDATEAEIKRMYTNPASRGQGVGRAVLAALEAEARTLGVGRLVLETGVRQPEAISLYSSAGFGRVPAYGEYIGSPLSVCMAKDLR